jgi:hypothetical protein
MSGFEISPTETMPGHRVDPWNLALLVSISFLNLKIAILIVISNPLFTQFIDSESLTAISQPVS